MGAGSRKDNRDVAPIREADAHVERVLEAHERPEMGVPAGRARESARLPTPSSIAGVATRSLLDVPVSAAQRQRRGKDRRPRCPPLGAQTSDLFFSISLAPCSPNLRLQHPHGRTHECRFRTRMCISCRRLRQAELQFGFRCNAHGVSGGKRLDVRHSHGGGAALFEASSPGGREVAKLRTIVEGLPHRVGCDGDLAFWYETESNGRAFRLAKPSASCFLVSV